MRVDFIHATVHRTPHRERHDGCVWTWWAPNLGSVNMARKRGSTKESVVVVVVLLFRMSLTAWAFIPWRCASRKGHLLRKLSMSVSGTLYESKDTASPVVTLFSKEGCTLCDKVVDVLKSVREHHDHALRQKDITDEEDLFGRYKYDIPVLHLDGKYWTKHRITDSEAIQAIVAARERRFESPPGEPNAAKLERKRL